MRRLFIASLLLVTAAPASAQLAGGVMGGVDGKVGSIPAGVTGAARTAVRNPAPVANGAINGTDRTVAKANARAANTADRNAVHVEAGASMRVAQGSRCYYDDYYYDPTYRDGYYYCERSGPAAGASVRLRDKK